MECVDTIMPALYVAGDTNKDHLCMCGPSDTGTFQDYVEVLSMPYLFRVVCYWRLLISQVQPTVLGGCSYMHLPVVYSSTGHCHND